MWPLLDRSRHAPAGPLCGGGGDADMTILTPERVAEMRYRFVRTDDRRVTSSEMLVLCDSHEQLRNGLKEALGALMLVAAADGEAGNRKAASAVLAVLRKHGRLPP